MEMDIKVQNITEVKDMYGDLQRVDVNFIITLPNGRKLYDESCLLATELPGKDEDDIIRESFLKIQGRIRERAEILLQKSPAAGSSFKFDDNGNFLRKEDATENQPEEPETEPEVEEPIPEEDDKIVDDEIIDNEPIVEEGE